MTKQTNPTNGPLACAAPSTTSVDGASLLTRYGEQLPDDGTSEAAKEELLLALYRIMQVFVDLGFSVRPGDKLFDTSDIGMDDVLRLLIHEDTAHETVAPDVDQSIIQEQP